MRALCLLREALNYRRDAFHAGLAAAGYSLPNPERFVPKPDDVLVIWNRYGSAHEMATNFERHGAKVIVAENGYLGKSWRGGSWYALTLNHHAGAGTIPYGGPERWDSWNVELAPWRTEGEETLIFAQRGIGEPGLASPLNWAEGVQQKIARSRIRAHPGEGQPSIPLEADLRGCGACATWHSAAANSALIMGVPVWFDDRSSWIGKAAGSPLSEYRAGAWPKRDDAARLDMFRRLAWGMWELDEIASGEAFRHLLSGAEVSA